LYDHFRDLGGHSLAAARILTRLQTALGRPVPVALLFRHPTVRALAAALDDQAEPGERPTQHSALSTQHFAEPVAVIGLAGRFPGAEDIEHFWRNLCDGVESVTFFTDEELLASGVDPSELTNPDYVKARAVLADA